MALMRFLTVFLIALLIGAGVLPATALGGQPEATSSASPSESASPSPSPTTPAPGAPTVYPVFNDPRVGDPDPRINDELVNLIDRVPESGQISAALFVVAPNHAVVDALLAARARGVAVRLVIDSGQNQGSVIAQALAETIARFSAVLGTDRSQPSYVVQCVNACISKIAGSINHNKYVLMSASGDLRDVVFSSTSNIRSDGSGDAAWNAATVSAGSPELYASFMTYFGNLSAQVTVPGNDYNAVQPPTAVSIWRPYYFPRTDGIDSVSQTLMGVDCSLTPTRIDVMASFFNRVKVRNRLNEMAAAGCSVRVIARTDSITRAFCDSLVAPVQVRIADKPSQRAVGIHGKYITIAGGFEGADRRIVWMGSENLTGNALRRNDETFLMIEDTPVHDAFAGNFARIWDDPSLTTGCDRANGVSNEQIEQDANQETTPLIKEQQSVKRGLPRRLTKRSAIKAVRTVQGQPLMTTATCRVKGTRQKFKARAACTVKRPKTTPTVVLTVAKKRVLRVRLRQTAPGSATLEPFARSARYSYRR